MSFYFRRKCSREHTYICNIFVQAIPACFCCSNSVFRLYCGGSKTQEGQFLELINHKVDSFSLFSTQRPLLPLPLHACACGRQPQTGALLWGLPTKRQIHTRNAWRQAGPQRAFQSSQFVRGAGLHLSRALVRSVLSHVGSSTFAIGSDIATKHRFIVSGQVCSL